MAEEKMNVWEKLVKVQSELKAPKNQYNSFGKYNYRSCEDILEGVKPLLAKYGASIVLTDSIEAIGDRVYVKATAKFVDVDNSMTIENTALAREPFEKKGSDESQITGAASSYARKYALNGLLLIDDTKDADTDENRNERNARSTKKQPEKTVDVAEPQKISDKDKEILCKTVENLGYTIEQIFPKGIDNLTTEQYAKAMTQLKGMKPKNG